MFAQGLRCAFCGTRYALALRYGCAECAGSLEVVYDEEALRAARPFEALKPGPGIWRFGALLPVAAGVEPVSLGEGSTPLLRAPRVGEWLGHAGLWLKNEMVNPTLSFKDRPQAVALTMARQWGLGAVIAASTGNTGVAAAAYAARAGLPCRVLVPRGTPGEKLALIRAYGATLEEVTGTFSDAYRLAGEEAGRSGAFNLTSTYLNPIAVEGNKTVAYELCEQLGEAPEWLVIPIGAGPLLSGCWRGFLELQRAGRVRRLPRLVGVQAQGCAPIVRSFEAGGEGVEPWAGPRTVASGIADPLTGYPRDGVRTLRAVRASGGLAVAVGDEAILEARRQLAEREGLLAENSAAAGVAALGLLVARQAIASGERVVCLLTGHGLKDLGVGR